MVPLGNTSLLLILYIITEQSAGRITLLYIYIILDILQKPGKHFRMLFLSIRPFLKKN